MISFSLTWLVFFTVTQAHQRPSTQIITEYVALLSPHYNSVCLSGDQWETELCELTLRSVLLAAQGLFTFS